MAEGEIKPPENLPVADIPRVQGLEQRTPPTTEAVEQMRFGLSTAGPLTQAVLTNNAYAFESALPADVLKAPTRCISTDRPLNATIGQMIYEIDTTGMYVWDGSNWVAVGTPGAAATVNVGTTTTGVSGSNASVVNSGTSSAAVFDFTIPRGDTGSTGATGPAGAAATVTVGSTTTGVSGSSALVVNTGSSSAAILDFTIPRGDTGATGAAATVSAGTTTTLSPGSSATVVNSGSLSAAVFDFGIPAGSAATVTISSTTTLAPGSPATVSNVGTSSAAVLTFGIPQGAAGVGVPTGSILPFGGTSLPSSDWLWCDGSPASQTTYATLYAVLGPNRYGTDSGGDFFLPDLRERFPRGVSSVTAGVTTNNTNTHTHNMNAFSATTNVASITAGTFTGNAVSSNNQITAVGNHDHSWANTGNHNHGFAQSTTPNVNRASGNLGTAGNLTHGHAFGGDGAHNHLFTGQGGHGHTFTYTPSGNITAPTINLATNISAGTIVSQSHIPAYVEVNYIIKT